MSRRRIEDILKGGQTLALPLKSMGGFVRRDSKAGFPFVSVHDGTCFSPLQIIADNTLSNYESEVKRLSAGCAVSVSGVLKLPKAVNPTSPGRIDPGTRLGRRPGDLSHATKTAQHGVSERSGSFEPWTNLIKHDSSSPFFVEGDPRFFSSEGFY